jgi:DNA-binding phage protein
MKVKTRPFDPAVHPNSEPEMAAYMFEALDTNDRAFIADARGVVARAREMCRLRSRSD